MSGKPRGIKLSKAYGLLRIDWEGGHSCELPLSGLRDACPCALCSGGARREGDVAPPEDVKNQRPGDQRKQVEHIHQVGNYALKIIWRDGHASGIYSWEMLRKLCDDAQRSSGESCE